MLDPYEDSDERCIGVTAFSLLIIAIACVIGALWLIVEYFKWI